ncbi:hypothetical protein [Trichocoleus sp. FACHB-591]|uniref:hypothetical protein n=1 Tax=Trichocoleus sp. FACHB-591 TaxID=2692872 RepID=UPI0018EF61B8|nr:hypothetical protein [Trichocoleus sp. FACHB-591]
MKPPRFPGREGEQDQSPSPRRRGVGGEVSHSAIGEGAIAWPKKPKDQLATIRDLLRTNGGEWTVEQVVAQFKGAARKNKRSPTISKA